MSLSVFQSVMLFSMYMTLNPCFCLNSPQGFKLVVTSDSSETLLLMVKIVRAELLGAAVAAC